MPNLSLQKCQPKGTSAETIPACVIAKITKQKLNKLQCVILQLTILAFFFAMRLCESATGETTNQNPLPPKSWILQKWAACKPPRSLPPICQLYDIGHAIW
jgi:hypothetical protein